MDSIADIMMGRYTKNATVRGGINSPFNEAVERVRTTITDQNWSFGRWCGYLKNIPPHTIHEMLGTAKGAKNVGKHFNWLVGEWRKDEKKKQQTK